MFATVTRAIANAVLVLMFAAAVAVPAMTHQAPYASDWNASPSEEAAYAALNASKPVNVPTWQPAYAAQHNGCVESLPQGQVPTTVLVVDQSADLHRVTFDHAWQVAHDDTRANDVWLVGVCA